MRTCSKHYKSDRTEQISIVCLDTSLMSIISESLILDITEPEEAHSDTSAFGGAAQRRSESIGARPPAPSKFNRRHTRTPCEAEAKPLQQVARPDLSCIKAMRRHIFEQIYDSELCPLIGKPEQEDLWASLDGIFMQ
jgi:hypothetical protein